MQLKGNFEASSLAGILQLLSSEQKSGVLRLKNRENDLKIFIQNGAIAYAAFSDRERRLANFLRSSGMITAEQLQTCASEAAAQNQVLSRRLVQQGLITAEALKRSVLRQTRLLLCNLFLWEKGVFEYKDVRFNPAEILTHKIDIMSVVLEASRRLDEMTLLSRQIPSKSTRFEISGQIHDQQEIKLNAAEWRFLTLIDGRRTVRDLAFESGYDDFTVYIFLDSLLQSGLIRKGADPPPVRDRAAELLPALLAGLEGILELIRRDLKNELARWPYTLLDSERPEGRPLAPDQVRSAYAEQFECWVGNIFAACVPPPQGERGSFFVNYRPSGLLHDNQQALAERLGEFPSEAEGLSALLQDFLRFLENLLQSLGGLLPVQALESLLTEIETSLAALNKILTTLPEADTWPAETGRVLTGIRRMLAEDTPSRLRPGTIFAFFNDE